jgi:glycosyltransferase involved in cell wall biosynthesis
MERPDGQSVTYVLPAGDGSLDHYARQLAGRLGGAVHVLHAGPEDHGTDVFGLPLLSAHSLRALGRDLRFVRRLRACGAVHFPHHHFARYGLALRSPYVVTVHDLMRHFDVRSAAGLVHRPNRRDRLALRLDRDGIVRATALIAVSETTKRDLVDHFGVPPERVTVVYEGIDHSRFRPVERRLLDEPYVLYVGSEQPRKNLVTLLHALAEAKRDPALTGLGLVKVGGPGMEGSRERTLAAIAELGLERDVLFTERVSEDDLVAWYSGALCLVLPSLYEGFGFPPVEAMACGCPTIVSDRGSLPEIAAGAALVVDPLDAGGLAAAIARVAGDERLRADLRARGLERARALTWERTAAETLRVYASLRGAPAPALDPATVRAKLPVLDEEA